MSRQSLSRVFLLGLIVCGLMLYFVGCTAKIEQSNTLDKPSLETNVQVSDEDVATKADNEVSTTNVNQKENTDVKKGKLHYENADVGFSFDYNQLMLDTTVNDDEFATLMHLSGDKAWVKVGVPNDILDDPEAWLLREDTTKDYKTYRVEVFKLDGYPARIVEYDIKLMGTDYRIIELIALKDGYFYTLYVMLNALYVEDTRTEFDVVVDTFRLSTKKVDLETLDLWKQEVQADFPFDVVPFFNVDSIDYAFGKTVTEPGGLLVVYFVKEGYSREEALQFYDSLLKGTEGYAQDDVHEGFEISGTLGDYFVRATIVDGEDPVKVKLDVEKK